MRYALVRAMLFGDMLRFDHFSTSVVFGPDYIGRGKALGDSSAEKHTSVVHHVPQMDEDDLLVVTNMKSMLVHDRKGRIYDFGSVCACLRRTWGTDRNSRGFYEMEAENCRWQRLPPFVLGE